MSQNLEMTDFPEFSHHNFELYGIHFTGPEIRCLEKQTWSSIAVMSV